MEIGTQLAGWPDIVKATHTDIFTDLGDQIPPRLLKRLPVRSSDCHQLVNRTGLLCSCEFNRHLRKALKVIILGDEIRFAVDLHDCGHLTVRADGRHDLPFSRNPPGLFVGLRLSAGTQEILGGIDHTLGVDQCFFALHHAGASALTQFFHQACGNRHHGSPDL